MQTAQAQLDRITKESDSTIAALRTELAEATAQAATATALADVSLSTFYIDTLLPQHTRVTVFLVMCESTAFARWRHECTASCYTH
jgi:hypothetical protein